MFNFNLFKKLGLSPTARWYLPLIAHHFVVVSLSITCNLNILEFLGLNFSVGSTIYIINSFIKTIYNTWIGVLLGHNLDLRKVGPWAVVTGATDGIGLAYCEELAKRGINVVLISRSIDKLKKCASDLEEEYKIKTIVIQMDFTSEMEAYEKIASQLNGLKIGTLINNVGMTYPRPTRFHELLNQKTFIHDILNINILAVTMMTGAVLPGMLNRGKGVVINVGSFVSTFGCPWFTLYSSTKAYMEQFTKDLAYEYKDSGIIFQYQLPGYVATKIAKFEKSSLGVPTPRQYAAFGINTIGLQGKTAVWIPHRIFVKGLSVMKHWFPRGSKGFYNEAVRSFWLFAKKREMERLNTIKSI